MRDKYASKTPFKRFLHKYTGFIICGIILAVGLPVYFEWESESEFFDNWSCDLAKKYYLSNQKVNDVSYSEMTGEQLERLNAIMDECHIDRDHITLP